MKQRATVFGVASSSDGGWDSRIDEDMPEPDGIYGHGSLDRPSILSGGPLFAVYLFGMVALIWLLSARDRLRWWTDRNRNAFLERFSSLDETDVITDVDISPARMYEESSNVRRYGLGALYVAICSAGLWLLAFQPHASLPWLGGLQLWVVTVLAILGFPMVFFALTGLIPAASSRGAAIGVQIDEVASERGDDRILVLAAGALVDQVASELSSQGWEVEVRQTQHPLLPLARRFVRSGSQT